MIFKSNFQNKDYGFITFYSIINSSINKLLTINTSYSSIIIISILFLYNSPIYGQLKNCKANISVEDSGNVDSASTTGVLYKMILTNTGISTDTYILSSINVNENFKNPDDSVTNSNVTLNTIFLDTKKNIITELTVKQGESIHFFTKLTIPIGTSTSKWSNNQIFATSTNCTSYKVDTVLYTYVLNPNNN